MPEEDDVQYGTRQTTSTGQYGTRQTASFDEYGTGHTLPNRVSVNEAAQELGVTVDAIRKRVQRGTIPHQRDESGRVWVLIEAARAMQETPASTVQDASGDVPDTDRDIYQTEVGNDLVESLEDQIGYLRRVIETRDKELEARTEELRRKDHIIAALTERIPELEPPVSPEPQGAPEAAPTAESGAPKTTYGTESSREPTQRRSWLSRFFFGP
jgi:hypothetical protein